jgi:hypothetical protein
MNIEELLFETFTKWQMDELVISRFTGLSDKLGVEIYEGDFIKGKNREGKILFKNGSFYCWDELLSESIQEGEIKVIGNIYENPELVKEL